MPTPPTPQAESITVTKTIDVEQTRDHLTQQQLTQIRKDVEEEPLDLSTGMDMKEKWTGVIQENFRKVNEMANQQSHILAQHPLPEIEKEQSTIETAPTIPLSNLTYFLSLSSFEHLSQEELESTISNAFHELANGVNHYNFDIPALERISSSSEPACHAFLTRNLAAPVKSNYATVQAFQSFLEMERRKILDIKDKPFSAETKAMILQDLISQSQHHTKSTKDEVSDMVTELEEFLLGLQSEEEEEEDDSSQQEHCVEESEIHDFLDTGMAALMEQKNIYMSLSELVDDLDESIVLAGKVGTENYAEGVGGEDKKKTLKDTLSLPVYPKFIETIDSSIEFIAGYSDAVDRVIDAIGGKEEGGVGKNLESSLNKLAAKVNVPLQYEALKKKAGITK